MSELLRTPDGSVELELDIEAEEVRIDGVVQSGEFEDQASFVLDQLNEGKLERVDE